MKFKPLYNRILVKIVKEELSEGGIFLMSEDKKKPVKGEVVAVGEGKLLDNGERSSMAVKVGDKILFSRYCGQEIELDGEDYLMFKDDDVICTIEE